MADLLHMTFANSLIFLNENCSIYIQISLKYVLSGPMSNNLAFI